MKRVSTIICLTITFFGVSYAGFSQQEDIDVSDNKLKIETEPALFFNEGRSIGLLYNVTEDNHLGVGMYVLATTIPDQIADDMFSNYNDSITARVTQEFAFYGRYRLNFWKEMESNPYVGLIAGWENIRLTREGYDDLDVSTFLVTPHIGYELYIYKRIMYFNTQIRFPFYISPKKSDEARPESLGSFIFLPSISLGVRF